VELFDDKLKTTAMAEVKDSGTRVAVLSVPKGHTGVRVTFPAGSAAKLYALYLGEDTKP
jgi:hypothetical protein